MTFGMYRLMCISRSTNRLAISNHGDLIQQVVAHVGGVLDHSRHWTLWKFQLLW